MLLQRSILLEVCLILTVSLVKASQFDYEDAKERAKEIAFHRAAPDYEKIYAASASEPVASKKEQNEEQNEAIDDFESYLKPSLIYSGSKKEPVQTREEFPLSYFPKGPIREFFEGTDDKKQLEEQQSKEEGVVRPGPSYVSYQVPAYPGYEGDEDKSASSRDETAAKKKQEDKYGNKYEEGTLEKDDEDYKLPQFSFDLVPRNSKPRVNYETGKSSSTVSQEPDGSTYHQLPLGAATYNFYNYQPVPDPYEAQNTRRYDTYSNSRPESYGSSYTYPEPQYESQPSEDVPSQFNEGKGKGCKKVESNDDTNCFVCENPKTNAKFTQCNYKSKKAPVDYYEGNSAKYTMPHKDENSGRYKRYANRDEDDPYTLIKSRSLKSFDEPSPDYSSGFQYEPEHYDASKPELAYSEQQTEDIQKNPENCKSVDRKGMTCTVCKDPKNGGNFEQCSYTSKPQEKKYAYVREKKFDSDDAEETKNVPESTSAEQTEETNPTPTTSKKLEKLDKYVDQIHQDKHPKKRDEEKARDAEDEEKEYEKKAAASAESAKKERDDESSYEVPSHFSSLKSDDRDTSSESAESNVNSKSDKPDYEHDFADFDEYHYKLFPEFAKQESRHVGVQQEYQIPQANKQNVETVLAEFSKKDRSNCKKAEKQGMTCYLCVDRNNIQHEECMYVQESRPQSSHVAYHEVKAVKDKNPTVPTKVQPAESRQQPIFAESKRKHFFKKVTTPSPYGLEGAASQQVGTRVPFKEQPVPLNEEPLNNEDALVEAASKQKRSSSEEKESSKDFEDESDRINDKSEPTIKTPPEFAPGAEYSDETKPVYSKTLGVKLPKYMLEKSEFEKEFDEFAGVF